MLVKHFEKCSLCFGDGEVFGSHRSDCPRCKGDGMVEVTTEKNREVIQEFTQEILVSLEDSELHDAKVKLNLIYLGETYPRIEAIDNHPKLSEARREVNSGHFVRVKFRVWSDGTVDVSPRQ